MSDEESPFLNVKRIMKHSTPILSKFPQSLPSLEELPELESPLMPQSRQISKERSQEKLADFSDDMICTMSVKKRLSTVWAFEKPTDESSRNEKPQTSTRGIEDPSSVHKKQSLRFAKQAIQDCKRLTMSDEESSFLNVKRIMKHSTSVFSTFSQSLPSLEEEPELEIPDAETSEIPPFPYIPQYPQRSEECSQGNLAESSVEVFVTTSIKKRLSNVLASEESAEESHRSPMPRTSTRWTKGTSNVHKKPSQRDLWFKCRFPILELPGIADGKKNRRRKTKQQVDWQRRIHKWEQRQLKNIEEATTYELEIEEV